MSSESALRAELLADDAEDTDDTLLTLSDLDREGERTDETPKPALRSSSGGPVR